MKSDKCEQLKEEINVLLANLQGVFEENEEIKKLREFLPKYFDTIKFSDGQIQKKGGVGEFLKGNGSGFENYDEIRSYSPFYENRDMGAVSKWAKWRNDGIKQMNGESCPFCTCHMEPEKIKKENAIISKVFKNSALSTASAVLEYLQEAVEAGYIDIDEFYPLLKPKELHIDLKLGEGLFITGDSEKIARVFNNLQKNAINYSYPKSSIEIYASQTLSNITVSIKNYGKTIEITQFLFALGSTDVDDLI